MRGLCLGLFILVCLKGVAFTPARAVEPLSQTPQLRIETEMHTSQIRRVAFDAVHQRLVTCSDDKTIRVWQLPEMELISVIRVPLLSGHEGQLYALALSPDGKTVAAGGWTGWDWEAKASIYFFDMESGEMTARIGGFDNVINALFWHPKDNTLFVGLQGKAGLQSIDVRSQKRLAVDLDYNDDITDIDWSPQGIVTVSLDGSVRLYDRQLRRLAKHTFMPGEQPISVKFSPDASKVAVALISTPKVAVLDARALKPMYFAKPTGVAEQKGFTSVTWSSDGEALLAAGEYTGPQKTPVYRWGQQGQSAPERFPLTQNRISEIQQLPNNQIVFVAEDPAIGVMDTHGKIKFGRGSEITNFYRGQLRVSSDASVVAYQDRLQAKPFAYSVNAEGEQVLTDNPTEPVFPPRLDSSRIQKNDWLTSPQPTLNQHPIPLEEYEQIRSYAFSQIGDRVALGTEWSLKYLDTQAQVIWQVPLPAVAYVVNVSPSGQFVVAALSDGTLHWYQAHNGKEILAYFPHANGEDWIAWSPDGYYASSKYGDHYVGWLMNRSLDSSPDFYKAVQFERVLYHPRLLQQRFAQAKSLNSELSSEYNGEDDIRRLLAWAPPKIRITFNGVDQNAEGQTQLKFTVVGDKRQRPMQDFVVVVNDIPITGFADRTLAANEQGHFSRTLTIPVNEAINRIRVESFNGVSLGRQDYYVNLSDVFPRLQSAKNARPQGNLYLLAIGANAFPNLPKRQYLDYAAQDAEAFAQALNKKAASLFQRIEVHTISDLSPTKPNQKAVLQALRTLEHTRAEDTVIVFLASHGLTDREGNYYFVPRDAKLFDVQSINQDRPIHKAADEESAPHSLIPWTAFFNALRNASGRRILVVDTCKAETIEGKFESYSLVKRSAASQFSLLLASKGNEASQEYPASRHGLFTHALLSAMEPAADADRDGVVSLKEWYLSAAASVETLRNKTIGTQTPQLVSPKPLEQVGLIPLHMN